MSSNDPIKSYCEQQYKTIYNYLSGQLKSKTKSAMASTQKQVIADTFLEGVNNFPKADIVDIWHAVYETHIKVKSGIHDMKTIDKIKSADQSWKKSSGHAFEGMIKHLGNKALSGTNVEIVLQSDLTQFMNAGLLNNAPEDLQWLKERSEASSFDLYTTVKDNNAQYCFGCIQAKTSIRDRTTRDREPSIEAMKELFWSTIVVLDESFLKNRKFISMVNGGSSEYKTNGWHGMYVFSNQHVGDRIYYNDLSFTTFKEHAIKAADSWLHGRKWLDHSWKF